MRIYILFQLYRRKNIPLLVCFSQLFFYLLIWMILPLENKFFVHLRQNFYNYYPQIKKYSPKLLDPLRIVIQTIFLLIVVQKSKEKEPALLKIKNLLLKIYNNYIVKNSTYFSSKLINNLSKKFLENQEPVYVSSKWRSFILTLFIIGSFLLTLLCVTQPLDLEYQFVFVIIMWMLALFLKTANNRITLIMLIFISLVISCRYIWWRLTTTVVVEEFFTGFCNITLVTAEIYSFIVMVLAYFQVCWVLDRKPYPLPEDESLWPSVDIMIPSYNEPLDVVKPCLLAAIDLDWPKDKLNVHMLDDGSRPEFEQYCKEIGVNYIIRKEHKHAKAGNINHALTVTNGELIAIFDCDHIPTRKFLKHTVGWLVKDPKIALVQTPHHFYSDDPFEKNLNIKGKVPSENSLFHDFIQKGNDFWNATMFCGSCAVIRRGPLEEIGGIAVETVTEDAHTSLRLNRHGYSSAFIDIPLAAGLSTESLADHINQRIRWARGMVQIFRVDNPLFKKGLTIPQRLCFANGMIHFLHGLPRIIFLLAPLPYLFFNIYVIFASGLAIFSYVVPHIIHSTITNQQIQGNRRFYFWGAIYETVLSCYITIPTLIALIAPKFGKFNVTAKGASNEKTYFDWTVSRPYIILIILNFLALIYGSYKLCVGSTETLTIIINMLWVLYNLLILGAASAVAMEVKQVRVSPRVYEKIPTILELADGRQVSATITNFSKNGLGISIDSNEDDQISFANNIFIGKTNLIKIREENITYQFECKIQRIDGNKIGLEVQTNTLQKSIEFIRCTFASNKRWVRDGKDLKVDTLLHGIHSIFYLGFNGYLKMVTFSPVFFKQILSFLIKITLFIYSLLPQPLSIEEISRIEESLKHNK